VAAAEGSDPRKLPSFSLGSTGIEVLWTITALLAGSSFFIGLALALATSRSWKGQLHTNHLPHVASWVLALATIVIGGICMALARWMDCSLDGTSDQALVKGWQRRYFTWIGLAEVPFFVGIAAVLFTARFWLYLPGVAFHLLTLLRVAPTSGHIDKDQEQLDLAGFQISLRAVLDAGVGRRHH